MNFFMMLGFWTLAASISLFLYSGYYRYVHQGGRPKSPAWLTNFWRWIDDIRDIPVPAVVSDRILLSYVTFNGWFAYFFFAVNFVGLIMFPQIVSALPPAELSDGLQNRVDGIGWSLKVIAVLQMTFFVGGQALSNQVRKHGGDFRALPEERQPIFGLIALIVMVASIIGTFWTLWASIRTLFPYFWVVFPEIFQSGFRGSFRDQLAIVPLLSNSLFPFFLVISGAFAHYSYHVIGEPILRDRFNPSLKGGERFQAAMIIGGRLGLQAAVFWSYILTIGAMASGLLVAEDVVATPRLYLSNFFFDAATLLATIYALSLLRKAPNFLTLAAVVGADAFLAFLFAILSVLVGLGGSPVAVGLSQAIQMFWFQQPDGLSVDATPYIWAMHTAFLPTIFLWLSIIAIVVGKFTLGVFRWYVLKRVDASELPIEQTAGALLFLWTVFTAIAVEPWQYAFG